MGLIFFHFTFPYRIFLSLSSPSFSFLEWTQGDLNLLNWVAQCVIQVPVQLFVWSLTPCSLLSPFYAWHRAPWHTLDTKVIMLLSKCPKSSLCSEGRDASKQLLVNTQSIPDLPCTERTQGIKTHLEKSQKTSLRRCHQTWDWRTMGVCWFLLYSWTDHVSSVGPSTCSLLHWSSHSSYYIPGRFWQQLLRPGIDLRPQESGFLVGWWPLISGLACEDDLGQSDSFFRKLDLGTDGWDSLVLVLQLHSYKVEVRVGGHADCVWVKI